MRKLTVLYDRSCPLCVRCKQWIERQRTYVELELLPCDSPEAKRRFGAVPWLKEEIVVVSDEGDVWAGAAAFMMCLWAMREWREWSYRLSGPTLAPVAERFFMAISAQRKRLSAFLGATRCAGTDDCRLSHPYR